MTTDRTTRRGPGRVLGADRGHGLIELGILSPYIPPTMKQFRPGEWCFDPYAKQCERCDTIVGRFAVMTDERGLRQVMFWPHAEWDGVAGTYRCRAHTTIAQQWLRLF